MATGNDTSYMPASGNHHDQGGLRFVIGGELDVVSGGTVDFESGGELNMASGSTFNMAGTMNITGTVAATSDGVLDMSTGGVIKHFVETGTTTANLRAYGVSTVTRTSAAGSNIYTLNNPITGVVKHLVCLQADSTDSVRVEFGAGTTLAAAPAATNNAIVWATSAAGGLPAGGVTLIGLSTALWGLVSHFGTLATTS